MSVAADPAPQMRSHRSGDTETFEVIGWAGSRIIEGTASTPRPSLPNRSGASTTILHSLGCRVELLPIPLLCGHGMLGKATPLDVHAARIGEVVLVERSRERVRVRAVVDTTPVGDFVWSKIQAGELRAFSVLSRSELETPLDGLKFVERWLMREVSVCRKGANQDATFTIVRPDASQFSAPDLSRSMSPAEYDIWARSVVARLKSYERAR
jgi:hypothetical protein